MFCILVNNSLTSSDSLQKPSFRCFFIRPSLCVSSYRTALRIVPSSASFGVSPRRHSGCHVNDELTSIMFYYSSPRSKQILIVYFDLDILDDKNRNSHIHHRVTDSRCAGKVLVIFVWRDSRIELAWKVNRKRVDWKESLSANYGPKYHWASSRRVEFSYINRLE